MSYDDYLDWNNPCNMDDSEDDEKLLEEEVDRLIDYDIETKNQ